MLLRKQLTHRHLRQGWGWILVALVAASPFAAALADGIAMQKTQQMIRNKFPGVPQISTAELSSWLRNPNEGAPLLLDVREPEEYAVSHIAGAQRTRDLESALALLGDAPKDRPIVVYCSVGYRSSSLAKALREKGYGEVQNLQGSIFAWANEGRPVYRHGEQVHEVHPYNWIWGQLLEPELRSR